MKHNRFEVYRGKDKLWYWRFRAKNGRITADGGEGYKRPSGAQKAVDRLVFIVLDAGFYVKVTGK